MTTLETDRLLLRPFAAADAPEVQRLAADREVAATTARIPHPYEPGMAAAWIASHDAERALGVEHLAIVRRADGVLLGAIALRHDRDNEQAELGYWIGRPHWGRGYATEAARAVVAWGFATLGLRRIHAHCFLRNPASARVLEKAGLLREGVLRQALKRWGVFEDLAVYSILREEQASRGRI